MSGLMPSSSDSPEFQWHLPEETKGNSTERQHLRYRQLKVGESSDGQGIEFIRDASKLNWFARTFSWKKVTVLDGTERHHVYVHKASFKKSTQQDLSKILKDAKQDKSFEKKSFESDLSTFFRFLNHTLGKETSGKMVSMLNEVETDNSDAGGLMFRRNSSIGEGRPASTTDKVYPAKAEPEHSQPIKAFSDLKKGDRVFFKTSDGSDWYGAVVDSQDDTSAVLIHNERRFAALKSEWVRKSMIE